MLRISRPSNIATFASLVLTSLALGSVVALAACSSDDTPATTGTPVEAGGGGDGGGGVGGDGGGGGKDTGAPVADSGPVVLNNCNTFVDLSAPGATRTITWTLPLVAPERCMTVKKGQEITWSGDFVSHPLITSGGDTPNPIADVDAGGGTTGKVTFTTAGLFGFECMIHPSMVGAIKVIE